jgi:hypothetical protein
MIAEEELNEMEDCVESIMSSKVGILQMQFDEGTAARR